MRAAAPARFRAHNRTSLKQILVSFLVCYGVLGTNIIGGHFLPGLNIIKEENIQLGRVENVGVEQLSPERVKQEKHYGFQGIFGVVLSIYLFINTTVWYTFATRKLSFKI